MTISAVLAGQGQKIFFSTFAPFLTYRAAEMIKLSVSYDNSPVCLVGIAAGLVQSHLGGTHCSIEDQSLFASFGNIEVYSPADFFELEQTLDHYLGEPKATYIRLTGDNKIYTGSRNEICAGMSQVIQGESVAIVFSGAILSQAIGVDEFFKAKGKQFSFYSLFMSNATNYSIIERTLSRYKEVFFVEEHTILGSQFSRIREKISFSRVHYIGPQGSYSDLGSIYQEALREFGLGWLEIAKRIEVLIN